MNFFRKIRILKRIYNAGYVDDEISEEAVIDKATANMLEEENNNEEKIEQLQVNNARLKDEIASKKTNDSDDANHDKKN